MTNELATRRTPAMAMGSLSDPKELGTMLAASRYFQDAQDAAQAVVKVLAGQELGFGPIASMTGVFIVKGRVTLSANLMAASIKRHPKYDYRVKDLTDDHAEVAFLDATKKCVVCAGVGIAADDKRCAECVGTGFLSLGTSEFTMAMARTAGLAGGDNWKKYPRNMLFARALSNGAKWYCPDVFAGAPVYTPDELGADIDAETGEIIEGAYSVTASPPPKPSEPEPPKTPPVEPASAGDNAADVNATEEDASAATPTEDPNRQVTDEEVAALTEYLNVLNAPEAFRTMATMAHGVADFPSLSVGQARDIMNQAKSRFGKAATT